MSTRAMIAIRNGYDGKPWVYETFTELPDSRTASTKYLEVDTGFKGVYHHFDGYPSALGQYLYNFTRGASLESFREFIECVIEDSPNGWPTIMDKSLPCLARNPRGPITDADFDIGQLTIALRPEIGKLDSSAGSYSDGEGLIENWKEATDCGVEYAYVFSPCRRVPSWVPSGTLNEYESRLTGYKYTGSDRRDDWGKSSWSEIFDLSLEAPRLACFNDNEFWSMLDEVEGSSFNTSDWIVGNNFWDSSREDVRRIDL